MNKKRIDLLLNRAKPALQNAFAMIGRAASQDFLPKILIIREGSSSKNQSIMFTVEGQLLFTQSIVSFPTFGDKKRK